MKGLPDLHRNFQVPFLWFLRNFITESDFIIIVNYQNFFLILSISFHANDFKKLT